MDDEVILRTTSDDVDWIALDADLSADAFHNGRTPDELRRSFEASFAVAFAYAGERVIGKARALSDGVCNAYVVDVWTHSTYRRQGIASRMLASLLARLDGQHVALFDHGAGGIYARLGFARDDRGYELVVGKWLGRFEPRSE